MMYGLTNQWIGKKIYGFCNGHFNLERFPHYRTIVMMGEMPDNPDKMWLVVINDSGTPDVGLDVKEEDLIRWSKDE